ncbi:DUF1707 and DUF4190 domain-containing protein [Kitasatospora sp. NPDC048194]|uniref:DUF1707 and DUF4190 domain-containing protein n=1 Tax=Kitasatospora sp. NPDC048194 TaxID=3364045 RepID=UPI003710C7A1
MSVQPWGESRPGHRHGHPPLVPGWQSPVPAPQAAMRASHTDRDRTVDVLKAGFAEGRLSAEEYEERHEAASRARTYGELAALVVDLPAGPMVAPPFQAAQPVPATFLPPPPVPPVRPTSALAVVSLVCSVSFLSLPAVVTGHIARAQIRERNMNGDAAAVVGLVLGYLGCAFWTLLILAIGS